MATKTKALAPTTPDETRKEWLADMKPEVREMAEAIGGAEPAAPTAPTDELAIIEKGLDTDRKAIALAESIAAQQFECARVIGQMQTLKTFSDFSTTGSLMLFRQVKETKAYKDLRIPQPDGTTISINTFAEFCEFMGTSYSKVAEDLQNLSFFGESFMESSRKAGLGYRDFRKLRALPEGEREELQKASDDPEILKEMIADWSVKNTTLKKQLEDKEATLKARDEVLADKNKRLDEARTELAKMKSLSVDDQAAAEAEKQKEALTAVAGKAGEALGTMAVFLATLNAALELPELAPKVREHLEGAGNTVASTLSDMFASGLPWEINFAEMVYPDWMSKLAEERQAEKKG